MHTHASSRRLVAILAALCAAIAGVNMAPAAAQSGPRERAMFVSAVNGEGEPVEGLGPEAFAVTEDGRRREVLRVTRATEPIDIALLIDNSQAASDQITFVRQGLSAFVAAMAPGNQIAVITIADRPTIIADYTGDVRRLSDAVGRTFSMPQSGMTLLDGIAETLRGLSRRESPRAVIVPVVTDGLEFTNRYNKDLVRALVEARVALHAVTVGRFHYNEEHGLRERTLLLDEGPDKSGGQRMTLVTPMGLEGALRRLTRELSSQYKVVYGRPESLIPPQTITVTSRKEGVTMRGVPARGGNGA